MCSGRTSTGCRRGSRSWMTWRRDQVGPICCRLSCLTQCILGHVYVRYSCLVMSCCLYVSISTSLFLSALSLLSHPFSSLSSLPFPPSPPSFSSPLPSLSPPSLLSLHYSCRGSQCECQALPARCQSCEEEAVVAERKGAWGEGHVSMLHSDHITHCDIALLHTVCDLIQECNKHTCFL